MYARARARARAHTHTHTHTHTRNTSFRHIFGSGVAPLISQVRLSSFLFLPPNSVICKHENDIRSRYLNYLMNKAVQNEIKVSKYFNFKKLIYVYGRLYQFYFNT